jgi:hypothetical protein
LSVDQDAGLVATVTITARLRKRHVTDTVTGTVTLFTKYTNAARDERKVGRARVRARERRSFFNSLLLVQLPKEIAANTN